MSDLNKELLLALFSALASLDSSKAGERKKRRRYPAGARAVEREREREREEEVLKTKALINSDEDHESDLNIILHHGNSYDNDY